MSLQVAKGIPKLGALAAALLISSGLAHASISSCVTTAQPAPSGFTGGNGTDPGQQISALPSATTPSVPADSTGCQSINVNYSNFLVQNISSGTTLNPGGASTCDGVTITSNCNFTISFTGSVSVTPTADDVILEGSGAAGTPPSGVGIILNDPGPTTPNQPFNNFAAAPNPWLINGKSQVEVSAVSYTMNVDPSSGYSIDQLSFSANVFSHVSGSGGSNAVAFLEVCPGQVTFTEGCAGELLLENGIINGHNNSNNITLLTGVFTPATVFGVREVVYLTTANGAGSDAGVTNLTFGIQDFTTPEPGTIGTMFGGLGALALMLRRRRKSSSTL